MSDKVTIGLDYGTNSVRAVVVGAADGREIATFVWNYPHGEAGIILDPRDPNMARQHPRDYVEGAEACVHGALEQAAQTPGFSPDAVIGIGVDTTGSTPLPVDADGVPLAFQDAFDGNPHAMAYLWKDHTGHAEAEEITAKAREIRPQYLAKCGGTYSSEWLWAKVWQCLRAAPEVYAAAHSWYEIADWIPAFLTGTDHPSKIKRCVCAAGHKGMYHPEWGGYPDAEFIAALDPALVKYRETLPDTCHSIADRAGELTAEWAERLGVPEGIPVAIGAFDAHLGAVGSGVAPGVLVKALGTSGCDMLVAPLAQDVPDIPGICGIVPESILPGCHGLEAGQSAVGDIFNWFVNVMKAGSHEDLTAEAEKMRPGESGLLALDWHNGNRTILVDGRLTGGVIGMTLATRPAEVYRALIEATAFGAPRHHGPLRGIRRPGRADGQLRRHIGQEPHGHANLRRRDESPHGNFRQRAGLRPRRRHRGRRRCWVRRRWLRQLHRRLRRHGPGATREVRAHPRKRPRLQATHPTLPPHPRRLRHPRGRRRSLFRHEGTPAHPRRSA